MAKELVTMAKYDDFMIASLAKQCLDDAGIPSVVVGEKVAASYPLPFAPIELQVNSDMREEALEILEAFNEAQSLTDDEDMDDEEEFEQES